MSMSRMWVKSATRSNASHSLTLVRKKPILTGRIRMMRTQTKRTHASQYFINSESCSMRKGGSGFGGAAGGGGGAGAGAGAGTATAAGFSSFFSAVVGALLLLLLETGFISSSFASLLDEGPPGVGVFDIFFCFFGFVT